MRESLLEPQVQRVLSGGRITINEEVRKVLHIKEGDYVIVRPKNGILEIVPCKVVPK